MAEEIAQKYKAAAYKECSARTNEGVNEVFHQAVRIAMQHRAKKKKKWYNGGRETKIWVEGEG